MPGKGTVGHRQPLLLAAAEIYLGSSPRLESPPLRWPCTPFEWCDICPQDVPHPEPCKRKPNLRGDVNEEAAKQSAAIVNRSSFSLVKPPKNPQPNTLHKSLTDVKTRSTLSKKPKKASKHQGLKLRCISFYPQAPFLLGPAGATTLWHNLSTCNDSSRLHFGVASFSHMHSSGQKIPDPMPCKPCTPKPEGIRTRAPAQHLRTLLLGSHSEASGRREVSESLSGYAWIS